MQKVIVGSIVAGLFALMSAPASADNRVSASKKGSLLMFSKVEIRWDSAGNVMRDTFIDLSNDYPGDVDVQLYFCNGDEPLDPVFVGDPPVLVERAHPGWNCVDCQIRLTNNQPTYWSALSGLPSGCQPFTVLDPGFPPGRPCPGLPGTRCLRGFVYAWAVDKAGEEIRWNHLSGDATIVDYRSTSAWEYNAYAFQACTDGSCDHGDATDGTPGQLLLDGVEYDLPFAKLLFDFYAAGSAAFSGDACFVGMDTDLTLHPVTADLRQDSFGPITTKAKFDIWNQNEVRFSGTERCITCWDQRLLSVYTLSGDPTIPPGPNHFLVSSLQTDKGKARIDGIGSVLCPFSVNAAMLGVAAKQLTFACVQGVGFAEAGRTLVGQGEEAAAVLYDIIMPPGQAEEAGADFGDAGALIKAEGRGGR